MKERIEKVSELAVLFACVSIIFTGCATQAVMSKSNVDIENGVLLKCEVPSNFWDGEARDVVLPDNLGITAIGDKVFEDTYITGITIPNGVTKIGNEAFWNCTNLKEISIPDSVTEIGENAIFYGTKIIGNSKFQQATLEYKPSKKSYGRSIYIDGIDDSTMQWYASTAFLSMDYVSGSDPIYLSPGKHTLSIQYENPNYTTGQLTFDYDFEAGNEYKLDIDDSQAMFLSVTMNGNTVKKVTLDFQQN
jgi:hypothetical protein